MLDEPKIEVRCDAGCGDSVVLPLAGNEQFKKDLERAGWLVKGKKHYCSEFFVLKWQNKLKPCNCIRTKDKKYAQGRSHKRRVKPC